jgi:chemotaxis protein methyltransferase CheR
MNNEQIELQLILEAIYLKYGYDFRHYSKASIRRRVASRFMKSKFTSMAQMQNQILNDPNFFQSLLLDLTVNVTEMFRDPSFYLALRKNVIPLLKTYPFIKIWHAGCATGEEVYSMAILLKEEGLLHKSIIYATDINEMVLLKAREGIYSIDRIKAYTQNYQQSGGSESFSNYYTAKYDAAIINASLKKNIVFSQHNLATDNVFGEMHLILCRNVLIYFNRDLQDRVIGLFHDSLIRKGILALGSKESIRFTRARDQFSELVGPEKIYQKSLERN